MQQLPLKKPLIVSIVGVVLFIIPFVFARLTEAKDPAGLGALLIGVILWPVGFVLAVSGILISIKRLIGQKKVWK